MIAPALPQNRPRAVRARVGVFARPRRLPRRPRGAPGPEVRSACSSSRADYGDRDLRQQQTYHT
eukprot:814777-Pyramimonas_sp.AAC.1